MKRKSPSNTSELHKLLSLLFVLIFSTVVFTNCSDDDNDNEPTNPIERTFVGSESCKSCHENKHNNWMTSGHPYKFSIVENGIAPTYPAEAENFQSTWMQNLGDMSHSWSDIAGVVGGYGWKARFVGKDGHIIGTANSSYSTGEGHNQINFFGGVNHGWVDYHPEDEKIYNYSCFKCHTTGGTEEGTWLEGVDGLGNFTEGGIGCESCHGPGSDHILSASAGDIDRVFEFAHLDNTYGGLEVNGTVQKPNPDGDDVNFLCGTCHNRGYTNVIDAKGGFIKHHEQWDEFTSVNHGGNNMTCLTCHNPHKRTIWEGDGIVEDCVTCHSAQHTTTNHSGGVSCIDCHMPFAAKSGTKVGESGFEGDIRSHLMKITVNNESMFTEDGSAVRDDATRAASLSPEYTCLGCHNRDANDQIPNKTIEQAIAAAKDMHK